MLDVMHGLMAAPSWSADGSQTNILHLMFAG
jgi:hypothetical protein